jgi:NAD(P)H-dependent FMN reductase
MKISIICCSHRENSESKRISDILCVNLLNIQKDLKTFLLDLGTDTLPLWSTQKSSGEGVWRGLWKNISNNLIESSGFIFVVPEYGGMATPIAKNFFLLCGNGELAHKPGLIVSVSSGNGGAYPIAELRSSSYKNTHIMWIPENIIIRNVESFNSVDEFNIIPNWLEPRINYTLQLLLAYASNMISLRDKINLKDFGNGM